MHEATLSGKDVLEDLCSCIRDEVYGKTVLPWHYTIPTTPPIFMTNVGAERSAIFSSDKDDFCASTRIMSHAQMHDLTSWLQTQTHQPALLASSVPVLLPPVIGMAEYLMGIRPLQNSHFSLLRRLGLYMARLQLRMAIKTSFDHWPVFADTWHDLIQALRCSSVRCPVPLGRCPLLVRCRRSPPLDPTCLSSVSIRLLPFFSENSLEYS